MDQVLSWLDGVLSVLMPADIFEKLNVFYNGTMICLGIGMILMLVAIVLMIFAVRKGKKHAPSV